MLSAIDQEFSTPGRIPKLFPTFSRGLKADSVNRPAAIDFFAFQMEAVLVLLVAGHREEVSRDSVARSLVSSKFFRKRVDEFSIQISDLGRNPIWSYSSIFPSFSYFP